MQVLYGLEEGDISVEGCARASRLIDYVEHIKRPKTVYKGECLGRYLCDAVLD